jgi:hypothetical protein
MKKLIAISLLIIVFFSCSNLRIEKRRYNKGLFVSWANKNYNHESSKDTSENKYASKKGVSSIKKIDVKTNPSELENTVVLNSTPNHQKNSTNNDYSEKESTIKSRKVTKSFIKKDVNISSNKENIKNEYSNLVETKNNTNFNGLLYFLSLIFVPLFARKSNTSFKIATWASKKKLQSRTLIGAATTTALISSFGLGYITQLEVSPYMFLISASLGASSILLYTNEVTSLSKSTKNKLSFSLLNIGTYFGSFAAGSSNSFLNNLLSIPEDPLILHPFIVFILTVLLLVLLLVSLYAVIILSCTIACNGYAVAAVAFLLGGGYLALYLFFLSLLNLHRKESQKEHDFNKKSSKLALISVGILSLMVLIAMLL